MKLAGMLLRGTVTERRAYYLEASVLVAMAEVAATGKRTYLVRYADGGTATVTDPKMPHAGR